MEIRHDPKKDRDEGDDFIFNLDIATSYPSLCQLQLWDATNTYLSAIVKKVERKGFDTLRPLTREGFAEMKTVGKLTEAQASNIANRIQKVFVSTINHVIQRIDPSSAV